VIAVVHAETSTGVRNDIEPLGAGKGDALLLVDCVTSLGGIPVEIDAWNVDIAYSGTQKCLGVPPGLAPLTVNDRARERFVERCQSWYLDLRMIGDYALSGSGRKYHHTAPTAMVVALHAGLGALLEEGLEASWARHAECGRLLQDGLEALGFKLFAEEGHRLPELTTAWLPTSIGDDAGARRLLLDRYGIEVGGGLGQFAGQMWRIGCMGHTARPRNVSMLLGALRGMIGE
jgi:alanine-glyoxylate transaminase/serine-glyoxylate transaminase/serine-pyruvate transaminase